MLNPFTQVNWSPDRREKRRFGLSLLIGFPIFALALFALRWLFADSARLEPFLWLAGVGSSVGLLLYLLPAIAKPFYVVWYALGCSLGFVISNVLMAVFYYVAVTGIGLVLRLTGRDSMHRSPAAEEESYWQDVKAVEDPARYFKQY